MAVSARLLLGSSVAASVALVATFLALGGSSYEPTPVGDPCEPREWRSPGSLDEIAQQFALSALDGAACELRVTRERLALALATPESRERFASEFGIDDARLESAVRAGLVRAVDDAEAAGALPPLTAPVLREAFRRVPVDEGIALIRDARELFDDLPGLLESLGNLLPLP
jgi:hypothetical protein